MAGPDLTILNWLLAASPLVVLAGAMLWLNRPAEQAGAAACALAVALALLAFGAEWGHVGIATAKGVNLAVFVLTIVWAAVFLYNVLDRLGAIDAIGRHMAALSNDQLAQALIIGRIGRITARNGRDAEYAVAERSDADAVVCVGEVGVHGVVWARGDGDDGDGGDE